LLITIVMGVSAYDTLRCIINASIDGKVSHNPHWRHTFWLLFNGRLEWSSTGRYGHQNGTPEKAVKASEVA